MQRSHGRRSEGAILEVTLVTASWEIRPISAAAFTPHTRTGAWGGRLISRSIASVMCGSLVFVGVAARPSFAADETASKIRVAAGTLYVSADSAGATLSATQSDDETGVVSVMSAGGFDASAGCVLSEPTRAQCTGVTTIDFDGGAGNDLLLGGSNADNLFGGSGNDAMNGGDGDDALTGYIGADDYEGGRGFDTAWMSSSKGGHGVVVKLDGLANDGTDTTNSTPDGEEHDNVRRSMDVIQGTPYADLLVGDDSPHTFYGFYGDDRIYGGSENDVLDGGPGNDKLYGRSGNDVLRGGTGNDTLQGDQGGDDLEGGGNTDTVVMGSTDGRHGVVVQLDNLPNDGTDTANTTVADLNRAGEEHDNVRPSIEVIRGTALSDVLIGDQDAQQLFGGAGSDHLYGKGGNDMLDAGTGPDRLFGGTGKDVLKAKNGDIDSVLDCGVLADGDTVYADRTKDPRPRACRTIVY
jgi:Ca2+-binding RTX toxin-like protein